MTTNLAAFTINGTPSVDPVSGERGYDATASEELAITLEQNPAAGANTVQFDLPNDSDPEAPAHSLFDTQQLWDENSEAQIILANRNDTIHCTINAATTISSYVIRCTVVTDRGVDVFERMVVVRNSGLRMTTPAETQEYGPRGWSDAMNELTNAVFGVGGLVTSVFGRAGDVVAVTGDYDASQVDNDSIVAGATVKDALDTLAASGIEVQSLAEVSFEMDDTASFVLSEARIDPDPQAWTYTVLYASVGAISSGRYPFYATTGTYEHYVGQLVSNFVNGYATFEVTAEPGVYDWIVLNVSGGGSGNVWFNVSTGVVGSFDGDAVAGYIDDMGSGKYRCRAVFNTTATVMRLFCAPSNGVKVCAENASPAFYIHGGEDYPRAIQRRVSRIDNRSILKNTFAMQTVVSAAQPVLFDPTTAAKGGWDDDSGVLFGGDTTTSRRWLDLLDPAGAYDLIERLSGVEQPWSLYIVMARRSSPSSDAAIFNLVASSSPLVKHSVYLNGSMFYMSRVEGTGATYIASMSAAAIDTKALYVAYFTRASLRLSVGATFSGSVLHEPLREFSFQEITLGGTTPNILAPNQCESSIYGMYLTIGDDRESGSARDVAIRSYIAGRHGVTT